MKKMIRILTGGLYALLLLQPVGKIMLGCFGYTFQLALPALWAAVIAAAAAALAVLSLTKKIAEDSKWISAALAFTAPLSLICAVFYLIECGAWAAPSVVIWVLCCGYLAARHGKPLAVKITALVLAVLLLQPVGFFGIIVVTFSGFGLNTVVRTVESPDGKRYAEVIDSDQGALGGDTLVKVYRRGGVNAILFSISPEPQLVYTGNWGEYEFMELYWTGEMSLVINGHEYTVE